MDSKKSFFTPPVSILIGSVIIALAILIAGGTISIPLKAVKGAKTENVQVPSVQPTKAVAPGPVTLAVENPNIKTFSQKKDAVILKEDGKPVIYLFSTTWCPHCQWIAETFDRVVKEYVNAGKIKAYHWEVDTGDNTLTTEKETKVPQNHLDIYQEFNPAGSIPTFVFGAKYFRTGNGYEQQKDLVSEEMEFKVVIEDLLKS